MFVGKSAWTTTWTSGPPAMVSAAAFDPVEPTAEPATRARAASTLQRRARWTTRLPRRPGAQDPAQQVLGRRDQLVAVDPALVQDGVLDRAVDGVVQERRGHQGVRDVERAGLHPRLDPGREHVPELAGGVAEQRRALRVEPVTGEHLDEVAVLQQEVHHRLHGDI